MLFKERSSRLELLIEKIQATRDTTDSSAGSSEGLSWTSSEAGDEVSLSPHSPSGDADGDPEVNFTLGPTETTPYACHFCEKAFPRLSYLKKHEQSHSEEMPFQCDFCQRLFKHKRSRDRHVKLHTGDRKYRCPHCESAFSRSDHLKIHMKTHDHQKPYQCVVCNRGYNTAAALTSHMQNHKKEQQASLSPSPPHFRCLQCTLTFPTGEELQVHALQQHPQQSTPPPASTEGPKGRGGQADSISCPYCTKDSFTSIDSLQNHVRTTHGTALEPDSSDHSPATGSTPTPNHDAAVILPCDFCRMEFPSMSLLESHRQAAHGLSAYLEAKAKENAFCSTCAIAFPNSLAYAEHFIVSHAQSQIKQQVSPEPPQLKPTDLSKKKSKSSGSSASAAASTTSTNHTSSTGGVNDKGHGETKSSRNDKKSTAAEKRRKTNTAAAAGFFSPSESLLCNQCSAGFSDFESFRSHLKTHLEENVFPRKFTCEECEEEFGNEEALESHATAHFLSTTTEYGCSACRKLYAKPDELQKHLMDIHAHHLFRCALCKELFDSKVSIQVHFAVAHSNEAKVFRCSPCAAVFSSQMEFEVHVKVTHLRRLSPYRCLLCNSSFGTELDLQFHLSTHQKPFTCTLCDEAFHVEFLLDRHMQMHHTIQTSTSRTPLPEPTSNTTAASGGKSSKKGSKVQKEPKCDICDESFTSDSELNIHRKQIHHLPISPKTNTPPPPFSQSVSKQHSRATVQQNGGTPNHSHQTLSLLCAYCNENCKSRTDLENHMKTHTVVSTGRQKCNICDEVCPTATLLAEHKLTHCKVLTGSVCTGCKQTLVSDEDFYSHMKLHSVGSTNNNTPIPVPCIVCRQTLMSDVEILLHAKFHTRDAGPPKKSRITCCLCLRAEENLLLLNSQSGAFLCGDCLRRTSSLLSPRGQSTVMSPHKMSPQSNSSSLMEEAGRGGRNKSYQCIKCQQTFGSEEEIQAHVATHLLTEGTRHECHLCSAKHFDSPLKLQTHLIEHTFEGCQSFRCYICSTLFTTPTGLQKHILSHGYNAAPYDCQNCQLKFFFRAELENHSHVHLSSKDEVESKPDGKFNVHGDPNHSSNQSESSESNNNSNQSDKNKGRGKRKRKKFFYRSDDSDEEMEEDRPIKTEPGQEIVSNMKQESQEFSGENSANHFSDGISVAESNGHGGSLFKFRNSP